MWKLGLNYFVDVILSDNKHRVVITKEISIIEDEEAFFISHGNNAMQEYTMKIKENHGAIWGACLKKEALAQ